MSLSNIDNFNESAGKLFAKLYENFPVPIWIVPEDFVDGGRAACYEFNDHLGAEIQNATAVAFLCVVSWLIHEHYVIATEPNRHQGSFREVVLTQKGLQVLDSLPTSLEYSAPIGERLINTVKSGTKEAIKTIAREALSLGIKTVTGQ